MQRTQRTGPLPPTGSWIGRFADFLILPGLRRGHGGSGPLGSALLMPLLRTASSGWSAWPPGPMPDHSVPGRVWHPVWFCNASGRRAWSSGARAATDHTKPPRTAHTRHTTHHGDVEGKERQGAGTGRSLSGGDPAPRAHTCTPRGMEARRSHLRPRRRSPASTPSTAHHTQHQGLTTTGSSSVSPSPAAPRPRV